MRFAPHADDLETHETVNLRYQSTGQMFRWPFNIGGRAVALSPPSGIVVDASEAALAAVVAGGEIGIFASFMTRPLEGRGELVPVFTGFAAEQHTITALWPESRRASPAVRAFLALVQELAL